MLRTISQKANSKYFWLLILVIMLPFLMISSVQIVDIQNIIKAERKEDMKHNMQIAFGVLEQLEVSHAKNQITLDQAKEIAKETIGRIRFDIHGYFGY